MPQPRVMLAAYVDLETAAAFRAVATSRGVSTKLRELVRETIGRAEPPPKPPSPAAARQVKIRLADEDAGALAEAARMAGMAPTAYLKALALAHVTGKPQWSPAERDGLNQIAWELRRIGVNVNQIALRLNASAEASEMPRGEGRAAQEAADLVQAEIDRLEEITGGALGRWKRPGASGAGTRNAATQRRAPQARP